MDELASKLILIMFSFGKNILTKTIAVYVCGIKTMVIGTDAWPYICYTFIEHGVYITSLIFISTSTIHATLTFACLSYPLVSCVS